MNNYSELFPALRDELDYFLNTLSECASSSNRYYCSRFLLHMQQDGLNAISMINISNLVSAINTIPYNSKHDRESLLSSVKRFLFFESEKGTVSASLPLILKYYPRNQVLFLSDFSEDAQTKIKSSQNTIDYSAEDFHKCSEHIFHTMETMKYDHWHIVNLRKMADLHYLFLSVNSLSFNKDTYLIWKEVLMNTIFPGSSVDQNTNRLLGFIEQWKLYGKIIPEKNYRLKILPYDMLPSWCRDTLDEFLVLKQKEGWKPSTIHNYRSSVTRFCVYLVENGFTSFNEITAEVVKKFNIQDKHKTPEGKNAYNTRIRIFLDYLGETRNVTSRLLFLALPCVAAPSTRIVVTLTEEEDQELERLILSDASPLTFREKAMLALGRYLGMRESDVANLCGADIDFKNGVISFVQRKTSIENELTFSVKIGNILYRYIMEERPDTDDPHVFIRSYAPYTKVRDSAPCDAFRKAFPERDVPGSNFHTLRKTFSTGLLRGGVNIKKIADIDGHRGTDSVYVYLSLDSANMKKCPLSLAELGITMKEHFPL